MKPSHKKSLICTVAVALCAIAIYMAIGAPAGSIGGAGDATHVGAAPLPRRDSAAQRLQHLARAQERANLAGGITVTGDEAFGRFAGAREVDPADHAKSEAILRAKYDGLLRTDKDSGQGRRPDLP